VLWSNPGWGTYGGLVRQLWSFAGDDDRASVNQTLIEPFLNYNLDKGWYLISDMIITANWQADSSNRWTVPLGGGVGKLLKIGNQAINVRIYMKGSNTEAYYNVENRSGFGAGLAVGLYGSVSVSQIAPTQRRYNCSSRLGTPPASSARITWATATSFSRPFTDSTSFSATSTT
jgi:hypothetical protein